MGLEQLLPAWGPEEPGATRRTVRDWVVDSTTFLLALAVCGLQVLGSASATPPEATGWLVVDIGAGVVAASALWLRRRWPVGVALGLLPVVTVAPSASAAAVFAGFGVAVHRRFGVAASVVLAQVVVTVVGYPVRPGPLSYGVSIVIAVLVGAAMLAWGQLVRVRRLLERSLRAEVARAAAEQRDRVRQARQAERTRIAREMHDVLAHRMSLLSMHAGALAFRPDLPDAERTRTAEVIRDSAHEALTDLRQVIGVLRDDNGTEPERPVPTLRDVPALLAEARLAGDLIDTGGELTLPDVPAQTGRDAYRVLQESLTNARKHAPGETVRVRLSTVADTLELVVANRVPSRSSGIPGSGVGLVGLAERLRLAGGELEHAERGGEFVLRARLPFRT